ncbi:hypothetical protein K2Z83_08750 [Oscillochloris sp. ZM17-4]|uniref:hypothetical protein n=1 Tax=Oscillochloris sp. ZM17-4 TaxID=2866714 RepID=UPI001C73C964|nr:hypothetical protein [Oscillochloris sp. ZM17-4]MBX0327764.1 hypothetical protein [Oscillochloris sp. ZM17-4]
MGKKKGKEIAARPAGGMAIATGWPVYEVLLSRDWDKSGELASALVARKSPRSGKVACASFLVDLACLGLKSTQVMLFNDEDAYHAGLRAHITGMMPMVQSDIDLAAKIVLTGVQYAEGLGFKPDPVFAQSRYLIEGADPDRHPTPVRTGGKDGKPLFINGPNDDVDKVLAQLERAVGAGNYDILIGGPPDMF